MEDRNSRMEENKSHLRRSKRRTAVIGDSTDCGQIIYVDGSVRHEFLINTIEVFLVSPRLKYGCAFRY